MREDQEMPESWGQKRSVIRDGIINQKSWQNQMSEVDSQALSGIFETKIVKLVWTVDDVARELECSVRHVRKLVSENKIPYLKIGRLVRFSPLRVREWLHKGGTR